MNPTRRIGAAVTVLVITVTGCSQLPGGPTAGARQATTPVTTPSPAPSSAATAREEAVARQPPVEFTGTITCGPPVSPDREGSEETFEVGDEGMVLTSNRGGAWRQTVTMSDPRLQGTVYHTWEADYYAMPGAESGPSVAALTLRIVNDAGAWEERAYGGSFSDGSPIGDDAPDVWVGQGAYAGLVAIMESTDLENSCGAELRGIIFDAAPVPEPYIP